MTAEPDLLPADLTEPELELSFPPKPEYVRTARHTVAAVARLHDVPDEVVDDLKLAVSEACTNAVSTHRSAGVDEPVKVVAWVGDGIFDVRVMDRGPGLDPRLLTAEPELSSGEFSFEKGLSLPLITGLMDDVEVLPREDGPGSVLRMMVAFGPPMEPETAG
jgi:anti-sigma regulatory factor (Ser/Thr protein kinase)